MLASSDLSLRQKPAPSAHATTKVQLPAWVNRLLGVRPAPEITLESQTSTPLPAVQGVTTASCFRAHPR